MTVRAERALSLSAGDGPAARVTAPPRRGSYREFVRALRMTLAMFLAALAFVAVSAAAARGGVLEFITPALLVGLAFWAWPRKQTDQR